MFSLIFDLLSNVSKSIAKSHEKEIRKDNVDKILGKFTDKDKGNEELEQNDSVKSSAEDSSKNKENSESKNENLNGTDIEKLTDEVGLEENKNEKKEEEKKVKKLMGHKIKAAISKANAIVLWVIARIIQIVEWFITMLVSVVGVVGLLLIIVAAVLIISIVGFLNSEETVIRDSNIMIVDSDCIQGTQAIVENNFPDLGQLSGTLTPYQQNLYKSAQIYNDILSGRFGDATAEFNSGFKDLLSSNSMTLNEKIAAMMGFMSIENGFIFPGSDDILKIPTNTPADEKYNDAWLGLEAEKKDFDGKYEGHSFYNETFVNKFKQVYSYSYPSSDMISCYNYVPYGIATQIGVVNLKYINKYQDSVKERVPEIASQFGIEANVDKLVSLCQFFMLANGYHGMSESMNEPNYVFWCALWACTSEIDSNRSFDLIELVADDYAESTFRGEMLGYSASSANLNYTPDSRVNGRIKINGVALDEPLINYVQKYAESKGLGELFQPVVDNLLSHNNKPIEIRVLNANYYYGLVAYLNGNRVLKDIGISMPIVTGGSSSYDCDCVETCESGELSFNINSVVAGEIQGDWPQKIMDNLRNSSYKKYFGNLYSIQNKELRSDRMKDAYESFEEWRLSTKWKIPYFIQIPKNLNNIIVPETQYSSSSNVHCQLFMSSYIISALTQKVITPAEKLAATGFEVFKEPYFELGLKSVAFLQYGLWTSYNTENELQEFANYIGVTVEEMKSVESETLQKVVDKLLEHDGLMGIACGASFLPAESMGFTSPGSNHYVVVSEKVGDKYRVVYYLPNSGTPYRAENFDLFEWDFIYKSMGGHWDSVHAGLNFQRVMVYNPNLKLSNCTSSKSVSNGSLPLPKNTINVPLMVGDVDYNGTTYKNVEQTGLLGNGTRFGDLTNYSYWYNNFIKGEATQKYVAELWAEKGKQSSHGIATIDGVFIVAMSQYFGVNSGSDGSKVDSSVTGSVVRVTLENGGSFFAIYGDAKSTLDSVRFGHMKVAGDDYGLSVVEWEAIGNETENTGPYSVDLGEWVGQKVVKVENYGDFRELIKEYGDLTIFGKYNSNFGSDSHSISSYSSVNFENFMFVGDSLTYNPEFFRDSHTFSKHGHQVFAGAGAHISSFFNTTIETKRIGMTSNEGQFLGVEDTLKGKDFNGMVVMLGANDLGVDNPDVNILRDRYVQLLEEFQTAFPSKPIYVQKIFPVGSKYNIAGYKPAYTERNEKTEELNELLLLYCNSKENLYFIDTTNGFVDSNGLLLNSSDGLHFGNYDGLYENIKNAILLTGTTQETNPSTVTCISSNKGENNIVPSFVETPGQFQGPWGDLTEYVDKIENSTVRQKTKDLLQYVGLKPVNEGESNYIYTTDKWKEYNSKGFVRYSQTGSTNKTETWMNLSFGDSTFGAAGCGVYSASGVLSTLLGRYINPPEIVVALNTYKVRLQYQTSNGNSSSSNSFVDTSRIHETRTIEAKSFTTSGGTKLEYTLYNPHSYDNTNIKMPLILYFVHSGEVNRSAESFAKGEGSSNIIKEILDNNVTPNAMLLVVNRVSFNFPSAQEALNVMELLESIVSEYDIDSNRISITGFSLGADTSFAMIEAYPNYFSSAVIVSGSCYNSANIDKLLQSNIPIKCIAGATEAGYLAGYENIRKKADEKGKTNIEFIKVPNYGHFTLHNIYRDNFTILPNNDASQGYTSYGLLDWLIDGNGVRSAENAYTNYSGPSRKYTYVGSHSNGDSKGAFTSSDLALIIEECGFDTETASTLSKDKVDSALNNDGMVIMVVDSSYNNRYTSGAHYVVIREKIGDNYLIYSSTNWNMDNSGGYPANIENTWTELKTLNSGSGQIIYVNSR